MRAGLLSVAATLFWACAAVAAEDPPPANVDIGDVRILLPPPAGQVEITAERMRKFIEAMVPPENRHLASYAPEADLAALANGVELSRWGSVHSVRELEKRPFLEFDFLIVRAQLMMTWKNFEKMAQDVDKEFTKSSERVKEAINVDMQFGVSGFVPVEIVADEADAFSTMLLAQGEVKARGQTMQTRQIVTTTMMRIADRLVTLYYYTRHQSDDDIAVARDATRAWIAAVRSANAP